MPHKLIICMDLNIKIKVLLLNVFKSRKVIRIFGCFVSSAGFYKEMSRCLITAEPPVVRVLPVFCLSVGLLGPVAFPSLSVCTDCNFFVPTGGRQRLS